VSKKRRNGGRRGFTAPAATAVLVTLLLVLMGGVALSVGQPSPDNAPADTPTPTEPTTSPGLPRSEPELLVVPAMNLRTRLTQLGVEDDNMMELPPLARAGWFTSSSTPGQNGSTIIAGHIRGPRKPGVFAKLRQLKVGGEVSVRRADGKVAVYEVTDITSYPVGKFPADEVYAASPEPVLRLITTGGTLRPDEEPGNVVVSAELVETR
jgi:hypothetical protein